MNRSIRPFFSLLAIAVLALTLTAPLISSGQGAEAEPKPKTDLEAATRDDPSRQLDDVLKSIGVDRDTDATDETDESWIDGITSPFDDSAEKDQPAIDAPDKPESKPMPASVASPEVSNNRAVPVTNPESEPTQASGTPPAITLDELLRQTRSTSHFEGEGLHARLAERRKLANAMRATLEAAQQVAAYGQASTQLLRDASLDTIVSTMIADKERERLDEVQQTTTEPTTSSGNRVVTPRETNSDVPTGFDVWRPVYIVTDERGPRIGWRHSSSGERKSAYVGESLVFDDDEVAIVRVSKHMGRRYLTIDLNGERRDVSLF